MLADKSILYRSYCYGILHAVTWLLIPSLVVSLVSDVLRGELLVRNGVPYKVITALINTLYSQDSTGEKIVPSSRLERRLDKAPTNSG